MGDDGKTALATFVAMKTDAALLERPARSILQSASATHEQRRLARKELRMSRKLQERAERIRIDAIRQDTEDRVQEQRLSTLQRQLERSEALKHLSVQLAAAVGTSPAGGGGGPLQLQLPEHLKGVLQTPPSSEGEEEDGSEESDVEGDAPRPGEKGRGESETAKELKQTLKEIDALRQCIGHGIPFEPPVLHAPKKHAPRSKKVSKDVKEATPSTATIEMLRKLRGELPRDSAQ